MVVGTRFSSENTVFIMLTDDQSLYPRNILLGGILFSACPSFRQHLRVLFYNFDSFCQILFKFTPHLDHQTVHV